MQRAEWLVERPWRLFVLVALVALPLLALAELAAGDTEARVAAEQRERLRSLAMRGADASATRAAALFEKLAGAAGTPRLKSSIGLAFRRELGGPREIAVPPDLRQLSIELGTLHALMREDVQTLIAIDQAGFVLEADPPGGSDRRVVTGADVSSAPYATAIITERGARWAGFVPERGLTFAVAMFFFQTEREPRTTGSNLEAVLLAELRPGFFERSLASLGDSVADAYVVDDGGRLLARLNGAPLPPADLSSHGAVAAALAGNEYLAESSDPVTGRRALVATAPLGGLPWHVVLVARDDALRAEVNSALTQQRGLRLGLTAVLLLGAMLVGSASSSAIRQRRATTEALEQQTATAEVLKTISRSAFDLQSVFDVVVENALSLCRGDFSYLYRRDGDVFRIVASRGGNAELLAYEQANPTPITHRTLIGRVALTKAVVHIPDQFEDPEYDWPSNREHGVHTLLGVPAMRDDEVVAVIGVARNERDPFSAEEMRLVEIFADQAAIAIENVRLFNETKEALAQQTALSEVLNTISRSAFDLDSVLQTIVERATTLCDADGAAIHRRDGDVSIVAAQHGDVMTGLRPVGASGKISDETVAGRAMLTGERQYIPDVRKEPTLSQDGPQTRLCIPFVRDGRTIGALGVVRAIARPYSNAELRLFEVFADQAAIAIENVRLFNETKESLERQTALGDVLRTMASSPADRQPVLDAIARSAARFCAAEDCGVALLRPDGLLEQVAHFGPLASALEPWPVDRGSVRGRAIVDRQIVHVEDMLAESEQDYPIGVRRAREVGQRTVLAAPLLREGVPLGAIALRRTDVKPFTEKQIELLRTFADQAVIAIENVRLFNETKEALAQQTALSEVLNTISHSAFDLDAVLQTIVERAAALCDADNASITRRVGEVAIIAAAFGELLSDRTPPGTSFAINDRTLIGRAMRTGERQYVPDARREPELPQYGPQTRLVIPFVRDGIAIGTLGVGRTLARPFSDAELRLFDVFADQAAIAIENVRLFNETKEALERQTALSDILRVIADSPSDEQPVLDAIARNTTLYCGAEDAVVLIVQGNEVANLAHHGPIRTPGGNNPIVRTGVAGRAILERRTIHVADLAGPAGEEFPLARQRAEEGDRHRGILAAPLLREGTAIGAILLRKLEPTGFTASEIKLVEAFADQAVIAIENVRLFNETKDALERQTAISEILRAIARSPGDEKPVLATIAYSATTFCGAEDASILLIRDGKFGFAAHHGPVLLGSGSFQIPMTRESVAGHAVIERRTVQVGDVLGPEGDTYPPAKEGFAETGQRAILATPLVREDQPIGAIVLRKTQPGAFTANQISLVEAFADQAVIAIENVRLFNETKEALERQTSISEVLETIGRSAFDLQPVLDTVVERAARLCEADYGSISTLEGDLYRTKAYWGSSTVPQNYIELMREEARAPGRGTLTGRTALEGRVIHIHDVLTDREYTASDMQQAGGYRTLLGVPLLRDREVIGVFALCRNDVKPFTERQIDLVRTFGDQAAIAIENVRLFNETKESLERQTALAEILRVIADSPSDRQPVLDAVARSATRYCGAEDAVVFLVDGNELRRVAHYGSIPMRNETAPLDERGVAPHAVLSRRTIHVADIESAEGDRYPTTRAYAAESGRRGSLAAPLMREGTPIGVILLRKMEPTGFTPSQIRLVEAFADQAMIALENVRLFNETKEALDQQTAVSDVLKTISRSAFDLQPVLDIVLNNAVRLAGADIGWLSRVENDQFMTVAFSSEFPKAVREELAQQRAQGNLRGPWVPLGSAGGLMGFTLAEGRTVHLEDVKEDPELKGSVIARMTDARTVVGVPMLRDGRSIGGMVLARYNVRPFATRELELVQTFADQAAIAIENVRLFNETKEALEQQSAISDVLKTISGTVFELAPTLQTVVENAGKLADADLAWMTQRTDRDTFTWAARYARTPELGLVFGDLSAGLRPGPGAGQSIMSRLYAERRTIVLTDVEADPDLLSKSRIARVVGARSLVGVPVLSEGDVLGAIVMARREIRPFSEREVHVVETFADQAAIAIRNVRLFNEIQDKSRQLEVASRHKSEFLANMSHELRTPLNAIIGFSEVLVQGLFGDVNEKQREYLQDVIGSGQHLLSLINDILDLSKIEAGRMELELTTFSLRDALNSGLTIVRERASRHNIAINAVVADDLGQLEADERKVKQIFYNLLSNAVKFTPDGGRVDVIARRDNGDARIEVRDSGIGIAKEDQARIFEEFQQVGRERSREGTGLGLTLTRRFVELHGGRISLESAPGKGSTFTFTLPLRQRGPVPA